MYVCMYIVHTAISMSCTLRYVSSMLLNMCPPCIYIWSHTAIRFAALHGEHARAGCGRRAAGVCVCRCVCVCMRVCVSSVYIYSYNTYVHTCI